MSNPVSLPASTAYRNVDVDETEDAVSTVATRMDWIHAVNVTADALYLHLYNATTANITVGTTTPLLTFVVPSQAAGTSGGGFNMAFPNGIAFGTALSIAATTSATSGTTGPATNGCIVALGYEITAR